MELEGWGGYILEKSELDVAKVEWFKTMVSNLMNMGVRELDELIGLLEQLRDSKK